MPAPPVDRILELIDHAETWVRIWQRLDRLSDPIVSVAALRFRAEVAGRKSRNSKTAAMRRFWGARARRLDEKADRLARSRP